MYKTVSQRKNSTYQPVSERDKAFDSTNIGIGVNTILGLPKAGVEVGKTIFQKGKEIVNKGVTNVISNVTNLVKNPIEEFNKSIFSSNQKPLTKADLEQISNMAIGFSGGLSKVNGITNDVAKYFAKEVSALKIESKLTKMGVDAQQAKDISPLLAKTKTVNEVRQTLVNFGTPEKQPLKEIFQLKEGTNPTTKVGLSIDIKQTGIQKPDLQLKRNINVTTLSGEKVVIEEGEALTAYEKGGKALLKDGREYIVSKSQYENIKNNSIKSEVKPFAPELAQTQESIKGTTSKIEVKQEGNTWRIFVDGKPNKLVPVATDGSSFTKEQAQSMAEQKFADLPKSATKFSQYQLPGGSNYKEVLIKAPQVKKETPLINKLRKESGLILDQREKLNRSIGNKESKYYIKNTDIRQKYYDELSNEYNDFKSAHWDEPNVISHLRLNERTYQGKKVTFMEELQSDWAREARAGKTTATNPNLKNWQELSIKRALQEAVNNNSEYLAWTTGEQQSARYNLSKEIKDINWKQQTFENGKTATVVDIKPQTGDNIKINVMKDGKVAGGSYGGKDWQGKNLADVVGKGLSEKILAEPTGKLEGEGLNIGGEWAKNLYDKQVKNIMEDLTGHKVEMLDMGLPIDNKNSNSMWRIKENGSFAGNLLTPQNMKVGTDVSVADLNGANVEPFIITDVLGGGKFKAIKKGLYDGFQFKDAEKSAMEQFKETGIYKKRTETFDISNKKSIGQQAIKITSEIRALVKGEAPKIQFKEKPSLLPTVIQGETFTMGPTTIVSPTIKGLKAELKATQKEIKNAQIAAEKAAKLDAKEQKIRTDAMAKIQRFRGTTENIIAELKNKNLSEEDIDNIVLENGMKLSDVAKVKRNNDGSLSTVITKKELEDISKSYTDEVPKQKWEKRSMLVNAKEIPINLVKSIELPYVYFERKGLSSIYDQVVQSQRDAEVMRIGYIQKFKDAGLYKDGSWFTANRFDISDRESKGIAEYYLGRQGHGKEIPVTDLSTKAQQFVKIFDEIINESTEPFYDVARNMGKEPGVVENYAPIMTREDIKLVDQGEGIDWLFRKHPAFFSLKERVKNAPKDVYETDYRKVAIRWMDGITQFINMGDTTNHLKYLINSDEFSSMIKEQDMSIINNWLKDVTTPHSPSTLAGSATNELSKLLRKGVAMGSLGLNYATILKQALTQIPLTIIEKAPPKLKSEYAKAFGINVSNLPSISKRTGDIAISDMQGKIGRIFTGGISKFDKMNAQASMNALLDKEYYKFLKEGAEITPNIRKYIEKTVQDKIDMWYGGFFKGQRPEAFREELGNFVLMFLYPLTSQTNGFFRHILKAKGFGDTAKAIAEVIAATVSIAYMEKTIENLTPVWSDPVEMTKDVAVSLAGNIPMVGDIAYAISTGQDMSISPVFGNINNIIASISAGDSGKMIWNAAETMGLPKQVRRITEGMQIMEDGGITDSSGKMVAPVQGTIEYMRAFLRGKYGPLASQDWIRNIGKSKEDRRWFVPQVEFLQNGDYERKAEIFKTFDKGEQKQFRDFLSEGQQKKLDDALSGKTSNTKSKSLSDIFK